MNNVAFASHYEMFAADGLTHLFNTANSDSRNPAVWAKLSTPKPEDVSSALRTLSGSQNARVAADW